MFVLFIVKVKIVLIIIDHLAQRVNKNAYRKISRLGNTVLLSKGYTYFFGAEFTLFIYL